MHTTGEERIVRRIEVVELDDEATFVVALAERADGTGQILTFQRSLVLDEQDTALDMDTYCLSDDACACAYGGVPSCILARNVLTLRLDEATAAILSMASSCHFYLHTDPALIAQLRDGLRRIFISDQAVPSTLLL